MILLLLLVLIFIGICLCLAYLMGNRCTRPQRDDFEGDVVRRDPYADWADVTGSNRVLKLTSRNIDSTLKSKTSALVLFYAPWCHHCHTMMPDYARAATILARETPGATLATLNCDAYPEIRGRHPVRGFPTILYYKNGRLIGEYHSGRETDDIVTFMKNPPSTSADMRGHSRRSTRRRSNSINDEYEAEPLPAGRP